MKWNLKVGTAFALVAVAALGAVKPARASLDVVYTTTASFDGAPASPGTSPVTLALAGGPSITFTGVTNAEVMLNEAPFFFGSSSANFGKFNTSNTPGGIDFGTSTHTFTLYITETAPTPTGGSPATYNATVTGLLAFNGSTATVTFSDPTTQAISTTEGPISFTVNKVTVINPFTTNGGLSSLDGSISAAPEPATLAMAFSALPLLGLAAWRNRRKAV